VVIRESYETYKLEEVVAIQIVSGGFHSLSSEHRSGLRRKDYLTVQLNLVLQNGSRLNVTNHNDSRWTIQTAGQLATFLKVPLLDHLEKT